MKRRPALIFGLAWADLCHEWILSLCLVLAVTAVISPIMLMFGVKYGTIETLRNRLIADPANREIRPQVSKSFDRTWFDQVRARPDVAFLIPLTRQISALLDVTPPGGGRPVRLNLVPSAPGDPLLLENGARIPGPGQCVLSARSAQLLGARPGDRLKAAVTRNRSGRLEKGPVSLEVAGVLGVRAGNLKNLYTTLDFLEKVESFKDGRGVPSLGWKGSVPRPYPVYDGLFLWVRGGLSAIQRALLVSGTGFKRAEPLEPAQAQNRQGLKPPPGWSVYYLAAGSNPVETVNLQAVQNKLRGHDLALFPWVNGLKAQLNAGEWRREVEVKAYGFAPGSKPPPGVDYPEGWPDSQSPADQSRSCILPAGVKAPPEKVELSAQGMRFELTPLAGQGQEALLLPHQLAGVLRLARERSLLFDPARQDFILERRGYAGFRMYAAGIDQVEALGRDMEAHGIPVHTEAKRISEVTSLDYYLSLIFWLIAAVALAGGAAALAANLYASVQRKQKELSILRLIGIGSHGLLRFPVYQGMCYALGGFRRIGGCDPDPGPGHQPAICGQPACWRDPVQSAPLCSIANPGRCVGGGSGRQRRRGVARNPY